MKQITILILTLTFLIILTGCNKTPLASEDLKFVTYWRDLDNTKLTTYTMPSKIPCSQDSAIIAFDASPNQKYSPCKIYVDGTSQNFKGNEFTLSPGMSNWEIGKFDPKIEHTIKLCCGTVCEQKVVPQIC